MPPDLPLLSTLTDGLVRVGEAVDAAGVVVIVAGALYATCVFLRDVRRRTLGSRDYRTFRATLGRSILLGLEFLVAGDIIRSISAPTFQDVGILAIIVAIRTWLSFTLEVELTGRWPWQQRPDNSETQTGE